MVLSGIVPLILLAPEKALLLKNARATSTVGGSFVVRERDLQILIAACV
jgi:hypothetical protein